MLKCRQCPAVLKAMYACSFASVRCPCTCASEWSFINWRASSTSSLASVPVAATPGCTVALGLMSALLRTVQSIACELDCRHASFGSTAEQRHNQYENYKIRSVVAPATVVVVYTGWVKKRGHRLMTIILSNLNRFNFFSLEDFLVNLQLNGYYNPTAPCICCYTTLWNIVSKTSP